MGAAVFDWVPGVPAGTSEVPFVGSEFDNAYACISCVFALALGFRQSAVESSRGTFLFLLHRPLTRDRIMVTKLATGLAALVGVGGVPILLYGWWASVPGNVPAPFEWSMTAAAWNFALVIAPALYLGAFLSGIRPGRWFGTRLLPLVAVTYVAVALDQLPLPWVGWIVVFAALFAMLAASVCHVARVRDYA
jgi:hypothetical protein